MKVSKKAYYGFRAILALAQAEGPVSIHTLAKVEKLPEGYLEKILQSLRRADLVKATKGISGGYSLTRPVTELNTWDILRVLDGPIEMFLPPTKGALPCEQVTHCQTNQVWRTLEQKIEKTLSNITLDQVLKSHHLQ